MGEGRQVAAAADSKMRASRPDLIPTEPPSTAVMQSIQDEVRTEASDRVPPEIDPTDVRIAGIDQAFESDAVVSAVVDWHDGSILEKVTAKVPLHYPYVSGYLAFREAPAILTALEQLSTDPDVLLFDGNGRLHPREAGLASHVGVVMDVPSIGVAKNLLCGELVDPPSEPFPVGTEIPVKSNGRLLGYAVQTRQWDRPGRSINPVYVSPGHNMDAATAVTIVTDSTRGYKLPEPIRLADQLAAQTTGTG